MLDVTLLGTGGMMPLVNRYLTSLLVKYNGKSILIDCGEGTQLALSKTCNSAKDIDVICITHFHADHISGLPGMLLLMGNQGKTSLLTIMGPKGTKRIVESLRVIVPVLPYDINFIEFNESYTNEYNLKDITRDCKSSEFRIKAFKVNHKIECYGYTINLDRLPKFDVDKATSLGIDKRYWSKLQHGESLEIDGFRYTPDMVLGDKRKGIKVTYCTDTRPCNNLLENAKNSDLFICEGMYGDKDKFEDAKSKRHMMMQEAAKLAKDANVNKLWLTHFSPSIVKPWVEYTGIVNSIFSKSLIARDGQHKELKFDD